MGAEGQQLGHPPAVRSPGWAPCSSTASNTTSSFLLGLKSPTSCRHWFVPVAFFPVALVSRLILWFFQSLCAQHPASCTLVSKCPLE